jgi:hypothetical protein
MAAAQETLAELHAAGAASNGKTKRFAAVIGFSYLIFS